MNDNKYHARITSYIYSAWIPRLDPRPGRRGERRARGLLAPLPRPRAEGRRHEPLRPQGPRLCVL